MFSKILSRNKYFVVFFVLAASIQTFGQSNIYLFGMGGINYIPMQNFSHYLNQFTNAKIDEVGFNGILGIKYIQGDKHIALINVEITNKNASFYGGWGGATWNFKTIPVAIGYQYLFANKDNILRPYA